MTQGEWLASLTVGDEVAVAGGYCGGNRIRNVDRMTATTVVVGGTKYRKSDGRIVGGGAWSNEKITPVTDEIREQVAYERARTRLANAARQSSKYTRESILAAAAALRVADSAT